MSLPPGATPPDPWWASGQSPRDGLDGSEDPDPTDGPPFDEDPPGPRVGDGVGPHPDGQVCDACPVCIGLRALRQARPDVVAHLADAAHHVSLALRAFAEAQAAGPDDGLTKIDVDP